MTVHILKLAAVEARTGKKKSSIYADIKAGRFPAPVSLGGRAKGWADVEINVWIEQQMRARSAQVPLAPPCTDIE